MKYLEKTALSRMSTWMETVPNHVRQTMPTKLEVLGECWGIQKVVKRPLDVAGLLYRLEDGGAVIFLNEAESPARQRFSWAHELGHLVMAEDVTPRVSCRKAGGIDRALERCCDVIATEILMPRQLFLTAANELGWSLEGAVGLAKRFNVSIQASALRLMELTNEPMFLSLWQNGVGLLVNLKAKWLRTNIAAKYTKPDARWNNDPEALQPVYQAFEQSGLKSGRARLLIRKNGSSRFRWVHTEALGIGKSRSRTVLAFHKL